MGDSAIWGRRGAPDRWRAAGGLCAGPRHVLKYVEGQRARADAANKGRASRLVDSHPHDSGPRAGTCPKAEGGLCQRSARGYGVATRQSQEPSSRDGEWHEVFQTSSEAHASLRVFLYCHAALHEFWGRAALRLQSIGHHQPSSSLSAHFDGAH